jgi:hypothetical protein
MVDGLHLQCCTVVSFWDKVVLLFVRAHTNTLGTPRLLDSMASGSQCKHAAQLAAKGFCMRPLVC